MHVTGVLTHTKAPCGKLAYAFVDLLLWPHDSNLTMTVLYNVLTEYTRCHDLPENLYLHKPGKQEQIRVRVLCHSSTAQNF